MILFSLGLFMNDGTILQDWRIPGVLQRFAIAYLTVGVILLFVPKIGARGDKGRSALMNIQGGEIAVDEGTHLLGLLSLLLFALVLNLAFVRLF